MHNSIDWPTRLFVALLIVVAIIVCVSVLVTNANAAPLTQMEPRWVCTAFPICWVRLNDAPDVWTAIPIGTKIEWWLVVGRWNPDTDWRYETRG